VNLQALGERSITLDCDVIQADGGTRTASITGAFVAMAFAINKIAVQHKLPVFPITDFLAAISVGVVGDKTLLDLNYEEDSKAKVDMNVVMTGGGAFVEVQGTGEDRPFSRQELDQLLAYQTLYLHGASSKLTACRFALIARLRCPWKHGIFSGYPAFTLALKKWRNLLFHSCRTNNLGISHFNNYGALSIFIRLSCYCQRPELVALSPV